MNDPLLITIKEAAALLGIGRTTTKKLIKQNELESVKIGAARRVVLASIHRYIERLHVRS